MYSELIKNYNRIRDYMREFYVYGFNSRENCGKKSSRTYDDERRRIESYLGEFMKFRRTSEGKNVFISIDGRRVLHNPLYQTFKAKSFTDGDITLHFILFDILYSPEICLTLNEITDKIDGEYLSRFKNPTVFDQSTVRKKLKEYTELGLILLEKQGKRVTYRRSENTDVSQYVDALEFFSESGLCGVIGSFLLDKIEEESPSFSFKHRYVMQALESEVVCNLLVAMSEKREVSVKKYGGKSGEEHVWDVVPLQIFISAQNGRRHLMAYNLKQKVIESYRLDYITEIKIGSVSLQFDGLRNVLSMLRKNMWGVSFGFRYHLEHVEFTVHMEDDEEYIYQRMEKEKRCGRVERIDKNTCRFTADIFSTDEIAPWIRTFIGRIKSMNFSNRTVENRIKRDLINTYRLYGLEEE